ncbi:MAG: hypothetical protein IJE08_16165 [Clostridia bacterium]|nr:hypothetical protein [Clostridia bacterium]
MKKELAAVFCARTDNDLVRALRESGYEPILAENIDQALEMAQEGTAVFALADGYPRTALCLSEEMLLAARKKKLKLYVEYPCEVLGRKTGEAETILFERLVAPDGFMGCMEKNSILMLNGCWHRPYFEKKPGMLCMAKVAGYDTAVYGLPEKLDVILDWLDEEQDVLLATSCLSHFITGRYAPAKRWCVLWQQILKLMGLGKIDLRWTPDVSVESGPDQMLSSDALRIAYERNVHWMYYHMITRASPDVSVLEGYESAMDCTGKQFARYIVRADCMGESAMEMAFGWRQTGMPDYRKTAVGLIEHTLKDGAFYQNKPDSPLYGLINWFEDKPVFYGDDNARVLLGLLAAREILGESRWDEKILRCVLANLRTSDRNGLRRSALSEATFKGSWLDYYNDEIDLVAPHYQAYQWAVNLWMYELTGLDELLIKAERAIEKAMELFPDKLRWQNSLTGELARMLLPLSFLMRVNPTDKHRRWLCQAVDALLEYQVPCGAIRDVFGELSLGKYPPPQSNERYGTEEASLIQENGDPATDMLYTTNWALLGLWEASQVLKGERVKAAYEKLRDFMLRIQVRSDKYPYLDGAWMRSFDYEKWEYWGSAADVGWSAWSIETGWVNAWIATVLMLEERGESLMQTSSKQNFRAIAQDIYRDMMTPKF